MLYVLGHPINITSAEDAIRNVITELKESVLQKNAIKTTKALLLFHQLEYAQTKDSHTPPIILAIKDGWFEAAEMLISAGLDVNAVDTEELSCSALHFAMGRQCPLGLVSLLLDKGVDPNLRTLSGNPPLHYLCCSQSDKYDLLIRKADPNAVKVADGIGYTALHYAVTEVSIIDTDAEYESVIYIINDMIERGADINAKNRRGETPLMLAMSSSRYLPKFVDFLLRSRACALQRDLFGRNILFYYAIYGDEANFKTLEILISTGCNLSDKDDAGDTVFHYMIKFYNSSIFERLLHCVTFDIGACLNFLGQSPLHVLCFTGPAVCQGPLDIIERRLKWFQLLLDRGCSLTEPDKRGFTPLHGVAAFDESCDLLLNLLTMPIDVNAQDNNGVTPLHLSTANLMVPQLAETLLGSSRCDVNKRDIHGSTALHFAVWHGNCTAVKALLCHGINYEIKDKLQLSAYDLAIFLGKEQVARLIKDFSENNLSADFECSELFDAEEELYENPVDIDSLLYQHDFDRNPDDIVDMMKPLRDDGIDRWLELLHGSSKVPEFLMLKLVRKLKMSSPYPSVMFLNELNMLNKSMNEFIRNIGEKLGEINPVFKNITILSGSVSEGTKVYPPNEFDYIFLLTEFSKIVKVIETDNETPSGCAKLGIADDQAMKNFADFTNSKNLFQPRYILHKFKQSLLKAISQIDNLQFESLYFMEYADNFRPELHFYYIGKTVKGLKISVDVIPAVQITNWLPKTTKPVIHVHHINADISNDCLFVIGPEGPPNVPDVYFRISFSFAETRVINLLPPSVLLGYKISKLISSLKPELFDYMTNSLSSQTMISSYLLKNSLLFAFEEDLRDGVSTLSEEDHSASLTCNAKLFSQGIQWAIKTYRKLEEFLKNGSVPCYFLPEYNANCRTPLVTVGQTDQALPSARICVGMLEVLHQRRGDLINNVDIMAIINNMSSL